MNSMRELLERTLKVLTGEGTPDAYIKSLVSDIEAELAKNFSLFEIKLEDMYTDATNLKTCVNTSTNDYATKLCPNKNIYSVVHNLNTERLKQVLSAALKEDASIITDISDYYFHEYKQECGEMILTDKVSMKEKQYFIDKFIGLGFRPLGNGFEYVFNLE